MCNTLFHFLILELKVQTTLDGGTADGLRTVTVSQSKVERRASEKRDEPVNLGGAAA